MSKIPSITLNLLKEIFAVKSELTDGESVKCDALSLRGHLQSIWNTLNTTSIPWIPDYFTKIAEGTLYAHIDGTADTACCKSDGSFTFTASQDCLFCARTTTDTTYRDASQCRLQMDNGAVVGLYTRQTGKWAGDNAISVFIPKGISIHCYAGTYSGYTNYGGWDYTAYAIKRA